MKKSIAAILSIKEDLESLFKNKDIPIAASWRISKFIRQLELEFNSFEENRIRLIEKYNEDGEISEEKRNDFQKEIEELLNVEVDLEIQKMHIKELGNITLSPLSLAKLDFMFYDDDSAE